MGGFSPNANLILVGFMGVGKSSLGRQIAENWSRPFLDTDKIIQEKTSCTIPEIFARHGEAFFRRLEQKCVDEWLPKEGAVISTGGGILTSPGMTEKLQQLGVVFVLRASPQTIYERTKNCGSRPLLHTGEDAIAHIKKMLAEREPAYAKAGIQIRTDFRPICELASTVSRIFCRETATNGA